MMKQNISIDENIEVHSSVLHPHIPPETRKYAKMLIPVNTFKYHVHECLVGFSSIRKTQRLNEDRFYKFNIDLYLYSSPSRC